MYHAESPAGRLIMLRMSTPLTTTDVSDIVSRLRMFVLANSGRVLLCGDLRAMSLLPPEHAELFQSMFARDNPKVERSALIVSQRVGGFGMQIERMVREANNPARRVFDDAALGAAYLDPLLTPAERAELKRFLAG